jgi:hypothetical protein
MWRNAPGVYVCRSEDMCAARHRLHWYVEHMDEIRERDEAHALERRRLALAEIRARLAG